MAFQERNNTFREAIAALVWGQEEHQVKKKKPFSGVSFELFPLLNKQKRKIGTFYAPDGSLKSEALSSVITFILSQEHFYQELCNLGGTL